MMIELAWGRKVAPDFAAAVVEMCRQFRWTPEHASWLMACMAFETGETFRADVRNAAGSGAVGLIQFMPATLKAMGLVPIDVERMTPTQQLSVVHRYLQVYRHRIKTLPDLYMSILLPKYIGSPAGEILISGGVAYRQNAGLDKNSDGKITKAEASARIEAKLSKGMTPALMERVQWLSD